MKPPMIDKTRLFAAITALSIALVPAGASASAQSLEGRWANPKRNVIVKVARCGNAYCGKVSWASAKKRAKGTAPGELVLSDLKPAGQGLYKGRAVEPRRNISGSATVRQLNSNVMLVKGCAVAGMLCKEQRWTRVSS